MGAVPDPGDLQDTEGDENRLLQTLQQLLAIDATEVQPALNQASDLLVGALGADKIDVFLYEPSKDSLVAMGTSHTAMGRHQKASGLDRLPLSNGGRTVDVFRMGTPYLSGHVDKDPEVTPGLKDTLGIRSMVVVPLDVSAERRGVLAASSVRANHFALSDVGFMESVSHWIGVVVHRAELVERMKRHAVDEARRVTAEQLVTVLAHDLGNRITPAMGRIDLLRRYARQEGNARFLSTAESARKSLDNVNALIKDLLDVSRLERGIFALSPVQIDLAHLVREVVEMMKDSEANISVRLPEELWVEADGHRVRQALENLLANAVKHGPKGVPVAVQLDAETHQDGDCAVITVRDEGPGIDPELLSRIFTPFSPGRGSTGLGIGLYLAYRIAMAHGGSLAVDSTPGTGTVFTFRLPIVRLYAGEA